jgi:hypothetical protein
LDGSHSSNGFPGRCSPTGAWVTVRPRRCKTELEASAEGRVQYEGQIQHLYHTNCFLFSLVWIRSLMKPAGPCAGMPASKSVGMARGKKDSQVIILEARWANSTWAAFVRDRVLSVRSCVGNRQRYKKRAAMLNAHTKARFSGRGCDEWMCGLTCPRRTSKVYYPYPNIKER